MSLDKLSEKKSLRIGTSLVTLLSGLALGFKVLTTDIDRGKISSNTAYAGSFSGGNAGQVSLEDCIKQADAYFENNEYEKAVPLYQNIIAEEGNKLDNKRLAEFYLKLGFSLGELERYDEGLKMYDKAVENGVEPTKSPTFKNEKAREYYREGIGFVKLKEYDKAINSFNSGLKHEPDNEFLYYELAWAYRKQGKIPEAKDYYKKSIKAGLNFIRPYSALELLAFQDKNPKKTIFYANIVLKLDPNYEYKNELLSDIAESKKLLN